MFKIALIDDEQHCVKSLLLHINNLFPDFEVVLHSTKPREAIKVLRETPIDLLFLDVEMPGINGFELLDQFEQPPFDVIFTTAYSQYAIQAFKVRAVDYLLKPIEPEELENAVERYEKLASRSKQPYSVLKDNLKPQSAKKLAVPEGNAIKFIELDSIIYCKADSSYTEIHFSDGTKMVISRTLKNIEETLDGDDNFFRCHKSYLNNMKYAIEFVKSDGGYLLMKDNTEIPVSPERVQELMQKTSFVSRK